MTEKHINDDILMDELLGNPFELNTATTQTVPNETNEPAPTKLLDRLSQAEQQKARQLAEQIPAGNYEAILTYGANAQTELTRFSHQMLDHVQKKDIGPVGDILSDLMNKLSEINPEELSTEKNQK